MSNWRTGSRYERFEYRLLNLNLQPYDLLEGVESCSLSSSVFADIRWGGRLNWSGRAQPVWDQFLVHPWYIVEGEGEWPLCPPCFMKAPSTEYSSTTPLANEVTLYDATYTLAKRYRLSQSLIVDAGLNIANVLAQRWLNTGIRFSLTPSDLTISTAMNFDPGESEMKVNNALLKSLGYWSVHANSSGVVQGVPWIDPASRESSWDFSPGETSVMSPKRTVTRDDFDVPNSLTGIPRTEEGETPVAVTVLLDDIQPNSPYTYANRGYWVIAEPLRDVDASNVDSLRVMLTRNLLSSVPTSSVAVTHAWLPEVELGSKVTRLDKAYTVQKLEMSLGVGLTTKAEWREL